MHKLPRCVSDDEDNGYESSIASDRVAEFRPRSIIPRQSPGSGVRRALRGSRCGASRADPLAGQLPLSM
jgi:hypothetical protein